MNNQILFQESEKKFITMTNSDKDKQEEKSDNKEEESDNKEQEESDNQQEEESDDQQEEESDNQQEEESDNQQEEESDDQQEEESDNQQEEESDNQQEEESDNQQEEESDDQQEEESDDQQEEESDDQQEESDDQQEEYEDELNYKKQILKSFYNYLEVVIKSIDDKKHNKKIINKLYYIVDIYYKNNYNKDTELIKIFNTNQVNLKKKENNIFEFFINKTIDINKRLIKAEDITNSILYLNNFTTTTLFF
jgi:hypothetical protein